MGRNTWTHEDLARWDLEDRHGWEERNLRGEIGDLRELLVRAFSALPKEEQSSVINYASSIGYSIREEDNKVDITSTKEEKPYQRSFGGNHGY